MIHLLIFLVTLLLIMGGIILYQYKSYKAQEEYYEATIKDYLACWNSAEERWLQTYIDLKDCREGGSHV